MLPLVLDIANLIKLAGQRTKQRPLTENEVPPGIQSLRRSFFSAKPHGFKLQQSVKNSEESESVAKVTDITKLIVLNQQNSTPTLSRTKRFSNDKKLDDSYHERKFNMTAFNSTENQIDQEAVASEVMYSIIVPQNLTLDEYENIALRSLEEDSTMSSPSNDTVEQLPTPEELIGRKRFRPPPKLRPKLSNSREIEDCEAFSGTICLFVRNYPK